MVERNDILDSMASLALFADLSAPQLEAAAHTFEEEWFTEGQRILRQGFSGSNFYVILEGEAAVRIDGATRATLGRGDFFGET
jgi:CRP-like cAMP-binding protein